MPPVVHTDEVALVEEDSEFLAASEITVFLLDVSNELGDVPLPVVLAGVADEKIEVAYVRHNNAWELDPDFSQTTLGLREGHPGPRSLRIPSLLFGCFARRQ